MDKELVQAFIDECKRDQEFEERWKSNHIEFDNYFKYSGEVEPHGVLISHYKYNENRRCNDLHEKFIKIQDYEKLWENSKNQSGRFVEALKTYHWDETTNSLWSD
tara:strand:- start:771 stop:1085 length:315 start_codon:yes stop_codon:yes gene_type:complete